MATRLSVDNCINRCEEAFSYASDQLTEARKQEHYYDVEFSEAQEELGQAIMELEKLKDSSNAQQRERLDRTRIKVQQLQNEMILHNHGGPSYTTLH
ncbi:YtzC family protein [Bacillus niameyensis]|uniref:YtzC family protein n=1 Tax=Bacillus niameyensis TaxID=1522308 RepID=UPI0007832E58|nr:YtzC family protein [Bacillus niameyensis]